MIAVCEEANIRAIKDDRRLILCIFKATHNLAQLVCDSENTRMPWRRFLVRSPCRTFFITILRVIYHHQGKCWNEFLL